MQKEKNEKNKKFNRPARIRPRNKQSHAQYVWIKQLYCEIDEIKVRLDKLENRNTYKEESEQSSKVGTT
jgi:hypothetical protein